MSIPPKPFHPANLLPGGVAVSGRQITVLRSTGQIAARSLTPPGAAFSPQTLFELFPDDDWCIGEPWQGQVELRLIRLDRRRQVDGIISFDGGETYLAWTAEVLYGETGPVWEIDVPLLPGHTPLDLGLRLALGAAIYRMIGDVPARGRPGETTTVSVNNAFTHAQIATAAPYRLRHVTTPPAELARLWGLAAR